MLKTETQTPEMLGRVSRAAATYLSEPIQCIDAHFEHGQWWVIVIASNGEFFDDPVTYSVVDAEGGDSVDGFGFEEV